MLRDTKSRSETGGVKDGQREEQTQTNQAALSLEDGQTHTVWKPEHRLTSNSGRSDILKRRKQLLNRVWATQQVLKVQSEQLQSDDDQQQFSKPVKQGQWGRALRDATIRSRRRGELRRRPAMISLPFHDIVSQYATTISTPDGDNHLSAQSKAKSDARNSFRLWKRQCIEESQLAPGSGVSMETQNSSL